MEPLFPPDGQPKQAVIELIGRLVDIHVTMEMDYRCAVCRMCQMTLEGFHKYRERCRTLDEVLQRKRMELLHYQVKVEHQEELAQNAVGFEEDMIYCLSDTDEEGEGGGGGGLGDELLEQGLVEDDGEEIDEEVEEELIRGDMLIKPEPYGMDDHHGAAGKDAVEEEEEYDDDDEDGVERPGLAKSFKGEQVVDLLDESEEDEKSMEASTRASSEAKGEDKEKEEPLKPLPFEVSSDGAYRCQVCQETFRLMKEIKVGSLGVHVLLLGLYRFSKLHLIIFFCFTEPHPQETSGASDGLFVSLLWQEVLGNKFLAGTHPFPHDGFPVFVRGVRCQVHDESPAGQSRVTLPR